MRSEARAAGRGRRAESQTKGELRDRTGRRGAMVRVQWGLEHPFRAREFFSALIQGRALGYRMAPFQVGVRFWRRIEAVSPSLFVLFCAFLWPFPSLATSFSFDDIEYWIGEGTNRAAVVIDWVENDSTEPALAWGYRWNGEARGRDMLMDVLRADQRLFAKLGDSPTNPVRVFGLGLDANDDGEFAISDGTGFDSAGIAFGNSPFFPAASDDPGDLYGEGWTFAFWHYGIAPANPYAGEGVWQSSDGTMTGGMANRVLVDGAWDSWVFSTSFDFGAFATNPQAAPAPKPVTPLAGDFNGDGAIDALDYDLWKSRFGSQSELAADGNGNGIVDAADYTIWRDRFGNEAGTAPFSHHVPEPLAIQLSIVGAVINAACFRRRRNR